MLTRFTIHSRKNNMLLGFSEKGIVFSIDSGIAFLLAFCMLFIALSATAHSAERIFEEQKNFELWKNTVFAADALVKNSDSENPLFGSAAADLGLRRVKSNEIDLGALKKISGFENPEFELAQLKIQFLGGEEKIVFQKSSQKKNCIAVERIVLIEGKTAKIILVGCNG